MSAVSGNLVEYFNFYMFAAFSHYFAQTLMPSGDSDLIRQIQTWAVYALSFFVKPLGSWLFGAIGDKYGRRTSLSSWIKNRLKNRAVFLLRAYPDQCFAGTISRRF